MTQLEKLRELNKLEKENRKNKLGDKLKQQEYYGETEELFDPLNKTLNAHGKTWRSYNEQNLALGKQTIRAIDCQNQALDKQSKAIEEAGSQKNDAASRADAGSQIVENTSEINETLKESI